MKKQLKTDGALYLVIDPALGKEYITPRIISAIKGGVNIIQLWDHWNAAEKREELISNICTLTEEYNVPLIINNNWELLKTYPLDGVHFDKPVPNLEDIKKTVGREFYVGVTCGNDLETVRWANANKLNYISFCSMFPSSSAGTCDFVSIETVKQAKKITALPIFLAGGITLENVDALKETNMSGLVIISAIMKAEDAFTAAVNFKNKLKHLSPSSLHTTEAKN